MSAKVSIKLVEYLLDQYKQGITISYDLLTVPFVKCLERKGINVSMDADKAIAICTRN